MTTNNPDSASGPQIIQWLVDTRPLWPVPKASPRDEVAALKDVASRALCFLTPTEQTSVLKYYHLKDAKMSLVSQLLKHLVITRYSPISWSKSHITRDANGKPGFKSPDSSTATPLQFNVSHQAGLVSLIAVVGVRDIDVGTDLVCVNERTEHDYRHIEKEGFFSWVDMHAEVFAESEVSFMKLDSVELPGLDLKGYGKDKLSRCQWRNQVWEIEVDGVLEKVQSNDVLDLKLRRFYAMWCLRETYVKMTGEALLAPWLKELEISSVKAPSAAKETTQLEKGEVYKDFRIQFKEQEVRNVRMELTALGKDFMVGAAVRIGSGVDERGLELGDWTWLDVERDVLASGEVMK